MFVSNIFDGFTFPHLFLTFLRAASRSIIISTASNTFASLSSGKGIPLVVVAVTVTIMTVALGRPHAVLKSSFVISF